MESFSESKSIISSKNLIKKRKDIWLIPGEYSRQLFKQVEGEFISISEKTIFNVKQLTESSIKGNSISKISDFKDDFYISNENNAKIYLIMLKI